MHEHNYIECRAGIGEAGTIDLYIIRSGYFAGHRLRYKNLFCRSLISSCWTLGLGLGLGYRRMMDVRVRVWIRI